MSPCKRSLYLKFSPTLVSVGGAGQGGVLPCLVLIGDPTCDRQSPVSLEAAPSQHGCVGLEPAEEAARCCLTLTGPLLRELQEMGRQKKKP